MSKNRKNAKVTVQETAKRTVKPKKKPLPKKKSLKKNTVAKDTPPTGGSLAVFNYANENFKGYEGKKGFELFQLYRDFFMKMISEPEREIFFQGDMAHYGLTEDFQLFDQAYIDNFMLCALIKIRAPQIYDQTLEIIDKRIRPKKQNEGLNRLYQECAGFLALLLQHYEGISRRQSLWTAAQLTKYSEGTVEKSLIRMNAVRKKLKGDMPPLFVLVVLYWTLHSKGVDPDAIEPFKKKSARSQTEIRRAVNGYWRFTEKVTRHYQKEILQYQKKKSITIFSLLAQEFEFLFPLAEADIKKPRAFSVLVIVCAALIVKIVPEVVEKFDAMAQNNA